jgi:hypothetical protein
MTSRQDQLPVRAALSARGLNNLSDSYPNDFTFITAAGNFTCPSFIAEFLSPKVSRFRQVDATYCCCSVSTGDRSSAGDFKDVLGLGRGISVDLDSRNRDYILLISDEFENNELYELVSSSSEMTSDNVLTRLKRRHERCESIDREIEFLISHIHKLSVQSFGQLDPSILREIVKHPKLQIESEDWLFDIIISQIEQDSKKFNLLEFIYFEMLSPVSMKRFTDLDVACLEHLDGRIWSQICARLVIPLLSESQEYRCRNIALSHRYCGESHPLDRNSPFDGIIAYLTAKHGGNVHDRGIVCMTQSSEHGGCPAKNCVDLNSSSFTVTGDAPNQWLSFDFKSMHVKATHYSIRTRSDLGANSWAPRSWRIEVSEDGKLWRVVDKQMDRMELNGGNLSETYEIRKPILSRFFRLQQIACHSASHHYLEIQHFELFGYLKE